MPPPLLETYRNVVYPWQCDGMGHMNTQFYAAAFDAAGFGILARVADAHALAGRGLGWADVRQVIEYKHEVRSGASIVVKSGIVRIGKSSITVLHSLGNDQGAVHATSETVTVLFDLKKRASTPFDEAMRRGFEQLPHLPISTSHPA